MKCDIVLAAIPLNDFNAPYIAPFLLKSILEINGFRCKSVDWNRYIYEKVDDKSIFDRGNDFFGNEELFSKIWDESIEKICLKLMNELGYYNPEWFGLSIMNKKNVLIAEKIFTLIRERYPKIKIIVGGFFSCYGIHNPLVKQYKKKGLIDYFVYGSGDDAIVQLLKGNKDFPGINNFESKAVDINSLPPADYRDVLKYKYACYYVYSSRGCVNNCQFCVENTYTKTFKPRKGELIVKDMDSIAEQSGNKNFKFADSLINGSKKEFRNLIRLLKDRTYKWGGMFLCNSWMNDEDYKAASEAGLHYIAIGIESASDRIRKEMRKSFNTKDIFKTIDLALKYDIKFLPQIIVGWPTETESDFQETLDMLTELYKYRNIGIVTPGSTLQMDIYTPAFHTYKAKIDKKGRWYCGDNTYELRKKRWLRLVEHCEKLNLVTDKRHWKHINESD